MNQKKLKIIYFSTNKFTIFSVVFLGIIFFQINQAKAVQECGWIYTEPGLFSKTCVDLKGQKFKEYVNINCTSVNASKPSICDEQAINRGDCVCCCKPGTAAAPVKLNDSMLKLNIPDVKLQITIPGLNLTKGNAINCPEVNGKRTCNIPWIGEYIAGVYKYAIGIVGILAAVVLMVGGVLWIIAGGSATMIGEAKAWIGASLTGLVIALCSYLILFQINPALTVFGPLGITQVAKAPEAVTGAIGEGWKYDNEIQAQQGDASIKLATLLNCMRGKLNGLSSEAGHISSISDSNCTGNLIACKNPDWPTCTTQGQTGCHWHETNSRHYGVSSDPNKSYAVDFNDVPTNRVTVNMVAEQCKTEKPELGVSINPEGSHLHVSVSP